ncbi:prepilin-type N-terminal cleavage/methylation domain-containing protein [Candidatus Falkowbacteria bacterium]|nr:prepilin-type N-terminal cleavage/methylation domain-containing protein [Candidatus Falkowbacteria bacterium]
MIGVKMKNEQGFTLVEIVVSLGIFAMLVVVMGGIFGNVIASQRSAIASKNVGESLSYAMEVITKELRSARRDAFEGNASCPDVEDGRMYSSSTAPTALTFQNKDQYCIKYYIENQTLMMERASSTDMSDVIIASTTSSRIKVTDLKFKITDEDYLQPLVTFRIEAESDKSVNKQKTAVQTTVSSRSYEHN